LAKKNKGTVTRRKICLSITVPANNDCLDIICTKGTEIGWFADVIRERYPDEKLFFVMHMPDDESVFFRIILNSADQDTKSAAEWLSERIVEKGWARTSDSDYMFSLVIDEN